MIKLLNEEVLEVVSVLALDFFDFFQSSFANAFKSSTGRFSGR